METTMDRSGSLGTSVKAANEPAPGGTMRQLDGFGPMPRAEPEKGGRSGLRCIRLDEPYKALGLAVNMLAKVEPYAHYCMDGLIPTVMAEIQRGHYCFTLQDKRVLGYAGWALCTPEVARAWVEGRYKPNSAECLNGSAPVLVTFHSKSRTATFVQIRYLRSLYPGQEVFFRRDYANGRWRQTKVLNVGASAPEAT